MLEMDALPLVECWRNGTILTLPSSNTSAGSPVLIRASDSALWLPGMNSNHVSRLQIGLNLVYLGASSEPHTATAIKDRADCSLRWQHDPACVTTCRFLTGSASDFLAGRLGDPTGTILAESRAWVSVVGNVGSQSRREPE
jgi:hypothetical protein